MAAIKMTREANRERAREVLHALARAYPDARCSLDFKDPLQLLVATILAAQCTDERVNITTPALFKRYRTAKDYVSAPDQELQEAIRSCGFYRQKAKAIKTACRTIVEHFGGKVPGTMEGLLQLDGVGRKTANVLLGECFNTPGIIVDTHCKRVSARLAFTKNGDPAKIEQDLMRIVPQERWTEFSHCLVFHGRATCQARNPKCSQCCVRELCPFPDTREGKKIAR
ncbi:MAG TPA: endonuclease III [Candidatus Hydrogenedentes bacterium]|nr:endonuclease III [Candidatus Hydrogenedentota bacterium]HQE81965.1 endonuclease III [Candidatus Hydrogenedentota bacterium]HQH52444.1 endonuclease III [Candidatus Hydrogenedentota bacterium]HQM49149.1 endonuclease III [Candidatus Hydrogenedentota bacterium]